MGVFRYVRTTLWCLLTTVVCGQPLVPADDHLNSTQYVDYSREGHRFYSRGKWGFINGQGAILVKPTFEWVTDSHEGLAAAYDDDGTRGYVRMDGTWAVKLPEEALPSGRFAEGRAWFEQKSGHLWLFGCVTSSGKVIISPRFIYATPFSEGLAAVTLPGTAPGSPSESTVVGYVDRSGKIAIRPQWMSASSFRDGRAVVIATGGRGYKVIDCDGEVVFDVENLVSTDSMLRTLVSQGFYDERCSFGIYRFRQGKGLTVNRKGLLDTMGRIIWYPKDWSVSRFSEGLASYTPGLGFTHAQYGFIDVEGRSVIEVQFDEVGRFREGLCPVSKRGRWYFINRYGQVALEGRQGRFWNDAEGFYHGLARVHVGGKLREKNRTRWWQGGAWYYINRDGAIVALCRQDEDRYITPGFGSEHGPIIGDDVE